MSKAKGGRALPVLDGYNIDSYRARHLTLAHGIVETEAGRNAVLIDEAESPLLWLARRKGRDGAPLIAPHQLLAGERLRAEFTRAGLTPCTTSNWHAPVARDRRSGNSGLHMTDAIIAARQNLNRALDAAGPELSGVLLDVCCFLKRLEDVERERAWPSRSAKVVLQLALDRLARHYGYEAEARGKTRAPIRVWNAPAEAHDPP